MLSSPIRNASATLYSNQDVANVLVFMASKSASVKAIELTRTVFESIHGNLGLLKFSIEELVPTNGDSGQDSKKWDVICSFYETLGSQTPTRYKASVNLTNNTVVIKKLEHDGTEIGTSEGYVVTPTGTGDNASREK